MKSLMPNNLGKKFVVEECQKLSIKDYLDKFKLTLKQEILSSVIEIADQQVELGTTKTGFGGERYWFKCPSCKRRIGVLLVHPVNHQVGCRVCLDLEYKKRRYKGMLEAQ
jgi:hypothetical protein